MSNLQIVHYIDNVFDVGMNTLIFPRFICKCKIGQTTYGTGFGANKKEAKQLAAKNAYQKLSEKSPSVCVVN